MTIEFSAATVRYRRQDQPALNAIDFVVNEGRTVLLGPNGAGKSTLLSVAASVLRLTSGTVAVDGLAPNVGRDKKAYRRLIGWMPLRIEAITGLGVQEQVALSGWLAGMDRVAAWTAAGVTLDRLGLGDLLDRRSTRLSGGQRARMGLAQALVHDPRVVLLDEPTAALDADQKDVFAGLLRDIGTHRTVLVSTHDVADLSESYEQVAVMNSGKVLHQSDVATFLALGGETGSPVEAYRAAMVSQ